MYKVIISPKAGKDLKKISKIDSIAVSEKLALLDFPFPLSFDIKKMVETKGSYRIRIGQARAIFIISRERKEIWVLKVGYRGGVYG